MKKTLLFLMGVIIVIWFCVLYIFPSLWQLSGGTFSWGDKMIYEGEVLFEKDDCGVSWTNDFSNIELRCPNQEVRTWANGVETKEVKESNK